MTAIAPTEFAARALSRTHVLVSVDKRQHPNVMALAWRSLGELWGKPVWIVAVAPSRHTFDLLKERPEFTLNVLPAAMNAQTMGCGSSSGRTEDKIAKFGLKLLPGDAVAAPVLADAELAYECKIIHKAGSGSHCAHTLFFGHILRAWAGQGLKGS